LAICPNCQAQVPDSARFCQECGARMPSQEPALASSVASQPEAPTEESSTPGPSTNVDQPDSSPLQAETSSATPANEPETQPTKASEPESAAAESQPGAPTSEPQEPSKASYNTLLLPEITAEELEKQRAALEAKQQAEPPANPQATVVLPRVEVPEPPANPPSSPPYATVVLPRAEETSETPQSSEAVSSLDETQPVVEENTVVDNTATPPSAAASPYGTPPSGVTPRYSMPPSGADTPYGTPPSDTPAPQGTPPSGTASPYATPPGGSEVPYGLPPYGAPQSAYPAASDANQPKASNKQLWWILGGIGCLIVFLLMLCAIFAFVVLANGLGQEDSRATPVAQATATRVREVTQAPRPTAPAPDESSILLQDDFSDASLSQLKVASDGEIAYAFENGAYAISVSVPRLIAWSAFESSFSDVYIQVESTLVEGPESAAASLIFRSQGRSDQDSNNFYVYNVTSDGRYNLELMRNNALETLIDWTPSSEINPRGEMNLLGVGLQGDQISLYVNNVLLEEYTDANFTEGRIALAVNTFDEGGAKVLFDNFVVEAE